MITLNSIDPYSWSLIYIKIKTMWWGKGSDRVMDKFWRCSCIHLSLHYVKSVRAYCFLFSKVEAGLDEAVCENALKQERKR